VGRAGDRPRALVTGGAGFIGSHLCERLLLGEGYDVVVCMDNLRTGSRENVAHLEGNAGFEYVEHDVTTYIDCPGRLDAVYHFASPASPADFERIPIPILKVGALGTYNALGLAKARGARFILASTSEVYGDPLVHPQREDYWGNVNPIGIRGVYDEAKRYAEAITMAYHRHHGVDTRIVRIFNSILADEQVLYDDGRELRREKVADLAARLAPRAVAAGYAPAARSGGLALLDPGFSRATEYPLDGYTVPSFEEGGRLVAAPAVALVAHPPAERCFEVRTRYGRSIRVTGHHSIFVEGPDGEPVARFVEELEEGERVAIARRIEVPERDRTEVGMLDVWEHAEEDPWDLLVEAPGLGALAWENRWDLFGLLVSERRNNGPNWRNGAWTKLIRMRETDRIPLPVLRRLGASMPVGARVRVRNRGRSVPMPAKIRITDGLLWLLGLFMAEGCLYENPGKSAFITISSYEEALLERAEAIVRRELGLHVVRGKAQDGHRPVAIFVHSKLLLRLMEMLGFGGGRKRIPGWILGLPLGRLKWFIEGYREGDGVHSGEKLARAIRHEFSCVGEELKDDLIVAFARFGLVPAVGRYNTTFKARTGERLYPFWRLTLCNVSPWSPLEWDEGVSQKLNARVTGDIVWASVTGISKVPATDLVYDFSVPGRENFWAGTGVMAHNTYGPKMRPDDGRMIPNFITQALSGEPLTIYGDGSQTRSVQYVDDLIEGIVRLAASDERRPVNIGNPVEYSVKEVADMILRLTRSESPLNHRPLPQDDPKQRCPDITRARDALGWEPKVPAEEGLRKTVEWFARRAERLVSQPPSRRRAQGPSAAGA
jgi:nucleoside-diphosphate-sugar epimerase